MHIDPNCESRFAYGSDGTIRPADQSDKGAAETMTRLGLNIPKLKALRVSAIEPFINTNLAESEFCGFEAGYLSKAPKLVLSMSFG